MSLTHPFQYISGKDCDRHIRRSLRHCQHWRQNNHQSSLCWWHWWLSRRGRRTGKISWASLQCLYSLWHGDQCWEDQVDDKQHQRSTRDQSKLTEALDNHKLQLTGLSCILQGSQAWDTPQDNTDDSSINKFETSLEWQEHFSQFQNMADALPCHIHLPVCLWIIDHTAELQRRIQAMEMRCYCKILGISYKDNVTKKESVPGSSWQSDHTKTYWPS